MGLFGFFRSIFGKSDASAGTTQGINTPVPEERRVQPRINAREGTRVLIIDDSPTVITALRKMLGSAGFVTMEAENAEKGLEIARDQNPELIFLDIVLPGMNGFAALRVLRRDMQTRLIPVIMMSGNEKATEQFFGTRIGADDFMKKPFSRLEVFTRIENLLDGDLVPRRKLAKPTEPPALRPELNKARAVKPGTAGQRA